MKIFYRRKTEGIQVVRCYTDSLEIQIPKEIDGLPVVSLAAYAFSDKKTEEDEDVFCTELSTAGPVLVDNILFAGNRVESVILPATVKEIGNYIFYGCKQLERLEFSNTLMQIGSGAFTGCGTLKTLVVHMKQGNKTCVKEILGDLWQRMDVTFDYEEQEIQAKLVFPEHYEEAVENTPARILFTQHHGSGNNYRQCFYNKELDFKKYDSLFVIAEARDDIDQVVDMAFARLRYPVELGALEKDAYLEKMGHHFEKVLPLLIERDQIEEVKLFAESKVWTEEMLNLALDLASAEKKVEILSYLMNQKQKQFPKKKRRFEL